MGENKCLWCGKEHKLFIDGVCQQCWIEYLEWGDKEARR